MVTLNSGICICIENGQTLNIHETNLNSQTHTHIHTHTHKTNGPITTGTPTENTILYGRWKKRQWIHQSPIDHSQLRTRRHTYRPYTYRPYRPYSPYKHTHPIVCYVCIIWMYSQTAVFSKSIHIQYFFKKVYWCPAHIIAYPILIRALRSAFLSFFVVDVVETDNLYALHVVCIRCILCACCMCSAHAFAYLKWVSLTPFDGFESFKDIIY